jgi:tRNA A-37 threonylcarbamoyl transferase component Bud32
MSPSWMPEHARCPSCGAPVSSRAASCALCDTPLGPVSVARRHSGRIPLQVADVPEELREVYAELGVAVAPSIRLRRTLGLGGMGTVFLGYDAVLKRNVAVKVLNPAHAQNRVARERFKREAEASAAVSHPNIVSIYQVGELARSGIPYFVMQYVDGPTLVSPAESGQLLTESRVRRLVAEVASGLAAAHRRGLVHRDIKPNNIIIDGETGRALVLDFGISAALDVRRSGGSLRLTTEGSYVGTPMYMSPEMAGASAELTAQSDVYSLGIVAFELLAGRPPFASKNPIALMASHIKDRPQRLRTLRPDVSPEFAALIDQCLEKDPARRPTAQDIENFLNPSAHPAVEWPPPGLRSLRSYGGRLLRYMRLFSIAVVVLLATQLGAPPASGAAPVEFVAIWRFVIASAAVVLSGLAVAIVYTGIRTLHLLVRGHLVGYPVRVTAAVAIDRHHDTEELRSGMGAYALLNDGVRRRIQSLRRIRALLMWVAFILAIGSFGIWSGAWSLLLVDVATTFASSTEALFALLPVLAALLGIVALAVAETATIARNLPSFSRTGTDGRPARELVQRWLTSASEKPPI